MISLKQQGIDKIAKALYFDGKVIIDKAYATADYNKDKTQNLHDSYGCAVYYNGTLIPYTKYILDRRATKGVKNSRTGVVEYGYDAINNFFKEYKAIPKGFELVTAAAMFYGEILTNASGGQKKRYKVIANAVGDLTAIASKYGGTVHIISKGQRQ